MRAHGEHMAGTWWWLVGWSGPAAGPFKRRHVHASGLNDRNRIDAACGAHPWKYLYPHLSTPLVPFPQARYNAHRRQQQRYLSELHTASQLASEEHPASGHAAGDQRIAMPAPGPLAAGLAEPGAVRQPKVHDVRTTPKVRRRRRLVRWGASCFFVTWFGATRLLVMGCRASSGG